MDHPNYDRHGNARREDPSTNQPRPARPKSRWDEDVYGPWVPVEPTRPNEIVQGPSQSLDTTYNEQYYYQDYYSPYYNLMPNNNATDSLGYPVNEHTDHLMVNNRRRLCTPETPETLQARCRPFGAIAAANEHLKHQRRYKCVAGLLEVWSLSVIEESGFGKIGRIGPSYSSNPYNTFNQNYDIAASMSEYLYGNQLPVNYGGYHSVDQPGSSAQSHQGSYRYSQQESYDKRKNKERNRATITERRKKNNATDSRGRTTRRKNGEREKDKPSRKTVVKKEIKSEPTTNTLQEEILNTKRKQLLKQISRSSRKERRKKTRSASEKNRQKKIKTFNRQCRSFTRKVLISKDKRSLSPASYQRYLDFQRFLINHYTSVSKYRVKRKKCIQRKNKKLLNIQKKKDKEIESLNQQSSNEKIHEIEDSSNESSDEENTQGEDKSAETEQVTESNSSRKRPRSKSPINSEKAKDENDNQENTKNENSRPPSKRFVKVKLNINIENPSCASDCSESCATMENLSFVEEIDVDKIIKLLNMDPNQETVSTEDTQGNARNEETLSQNNLTKDDLPKNNTSDENEHVQANQTNKVPSSDHEIIDLTLEDDGEVKENNENPKMPKTKTVGEPAKDSSQNKSANKQNPKTNKLAPNKNPKETGETVASKAKPNNPNQKDGTNSQQSKKETVKDKDSSKNNSSRKDSTKNDSSRKDSTKNDSSRKDSTKNDSSRKDSTKNNSSRKDSTKYDSSRKDSTKNDSSRKDSTKNDSSRKDSTKNDSSRRNSRRNDSSRKDSTKYDRSRKDSTKYDRSRKDSTRIDKTSRKDNSKEDKSRTNTSNSDRDKTRRSEKRRSSDDRDRDRDSKHNDKSKNSDGKTRDMKISQILNYAV
uniref:SFRICE_002075 n=1 Tax=Spodoptera frugiperda TaxID=7108 RepID=A0A2H1WGH5_SPOFR